MPKTSHAQTEHAPLNAHNHALLAQIAHSPCTAAETLDDEPRTGRSHPVERTVSTWRVSILVQGSGVFIGEYATHNEALRAAQYACEHHPDAQTHDIQPIERTQLNVVLPVYDHTEHGAQHTPMLYRVTAFYPTHDLTFSRAEVKGFYDDYGMAQGAQAIAMGNTPKHLLHRSHQQCDTCIIDTIEHNEATPYKACIVLAHGEVFVVGCYVDVDKANNAIKRMYARLNGVDWFIDAFDKQSSLIKLEARHE